MFILFARTLRRNPSLGTLVRSLWVGSLASTGFNSNNSIGFMPPSHVIDPAEWRSEIFPDSLCVILSSCKNLTRLAIINCPLVSVPQWSRIEHSFPPRLRTLAMGPEHAMMGSTNPYTYLERFISIDTTLVHIELARVASLPCLKYLECRFLSDSSVMKLEDPRRFGQKLGVALQSTSLRHVRVLHDDDRMPRDWAIHCCKDQRVEFVRRRQKEADRWSADWVVDFYDEWKKDVTGSHSMHKPPPSYPAALEPT